MDGDGLEPPREANLGAASMANLGAASGATGPGGSPAPARAAGRWSFV